LREWFFTLGQVRADQDPTAANAKQCDDGQNDPQPGSSLYDFILLYSGFVRQAAARLCDG
jgi:hypothetical protein